MEQVIQTAHGAVRCTITRKKMKNMRIRVTADSRVVVSAPLHIAQSRIQHFIAQNAAYIFQQQQQTETRRRHSYPAAYQSGDTFCFLGQQKRLVVEHAQKQAAVMTGDTLVLRLPEHGNARQLFALWMARAARELFAQRLAVVSERFGEDGMGLSVRRMLTRWGSINTRSRRVSLSVHLMRCERDLIDYVITHELCHLKNAGHCRAFYRALEHHFPDRRALDKRLKSYGLVDF